MYLIIISSRYSSICLKKYNNTICKRFFRSKKIIKVILSSTTRIRLIIYIEDPEEASGVDYVYIEEDTKVKKTTVADIITTSYLIRSDTISVINQDAS